MKGLIYKEIDYIIKGDTLFNETETVFICIFCHTFISSVLFSSQSS